MKRRIQFRNSLIILTLLLSATVMGQTFWGTTPIGGRYGNGTIFSFNAQSGTYHTAYDFKPNPVFRAYNAFEESPNVYIGVCTHSIENGSSEELRDGNSIYRYNAITDTTEIIFNYPYSTYHSENIGDMIYIKNKAILGLSNVDDTVKLIRYDISTDTYQEFGTFYSGSYPEIGVTAHYTTTSYLSEINDSMVIFSLTKVVGAANSSKISKGCDFFAYNPQTNAIDSLFNIPNSEPHISKGPLTQTADKRIFAPMNRSIVELNLSEKTYHTVHTFSDAYIVKGEMIQATDSSLIGLENKTKNGYLFEYNFKNDSLMTEQKLSYKGQYNSFVKRGDSVYFSLDNDHNDQILYYKIGSAQTPVVAFILDNPNQGEIEHLINTSHENSIITFSNSLAEYQPKGNSYINLVRFEDDFYEGAKDGSTPQNDLLLASNKKLYGIATNGGSGTYLHGDGVLFEMDPVTEAYKVLVNFTGKNGGFGDTDNYGTRYLEGQNNLVEVNQKIYGATYTNGDYDHSGPGYGVIYSYDLSKDSDNYHVIIDLNDSSKASAGRLPMSGMTLGSNGKLYGTTFSGGSGIYGNGVVYEIDPNDNDKFRVVMNIPLGSKPPVDNLVEGDNGKFYGLAINTTYMVRNTTWAIREYDMENQSFVDIYTSDSVDNAYNYSQFYYLDHKLYGVVTKTTDTNGYLFEYDITTSQMVQKVIFNNTTSTGSQPKGNLCLSSTGSFWGMTSRGGTSSDGSGYNDMGVIYEFNPSDDVFTMHYAFGREGSNPQYASLTETAAAYYSDTIPSDSSTITFYASVDGTLGIGVNISINNQILTTDSLAKVSIKLKNGDYKYVAYYNELRNDTVNLTVERDRSIKVKLYSDTTPSDSSTITFYASVDGTLGIGVNININNQTLTTDSLAKVSIKLKNGDYKYVAYYNELRNDTVNLTVERDQSVKVKLYSNTSINTSKAYITNIYPNPTKHSLTLITEKKAHFSLLTISGQIIRTGNLHEGKNTLNISQLANGLYFLKIEINGQCSIKKIIKE